MNGTEGKHQGQLVLLFMLQASNHRQWIPLSLFANGIASTSRSAVIYPSFSPQSLPAPRRLCLRPCRFVCFLVGFLKKNNCRTDFQETWWKEPTDNKRGISFHYLEHSWFFYSMICSKCGKWSQCGHACNLYSPKRPTEGDWTDRSLWLHYITFHLAFIQSNLQFCICVLWGTIRGSASCSRTLRHDWGSNCRPSGWRTTTLPPQPQPPNLWLTASTVQVVGLKLSVRPNPPLLQIWFQIIQNGSRQIPNSRLENCSSQTNEEPHGGLPLNWIWGDHWPLAVACALLVPTLLVPVVKFGCWTYKWC